MMVSANDEDRQKKEKEAGILALANRKLILMIPDTRCLTNVCLSVSPCSGDLSPRAALKETSGTTANFFCSRQMIQTISIRGQCLG